MGFDPTGQYLLAVSHNGRGVFETNQWTKLARDDEPVYPDDGKIEGIGPLAGQQVNVIEKNYDTDELIVTDPTGQYELTLEDFGMVVVREVKD